MSRFVAGVAVLLSWLALACSSDSGIPTRDVVADIPWAGDEEWQFNLLDEDGETIAAGFHTISTAGGETTFVTRYEAPDGNTDTTTVVVDAATLKPISSLREIENDNPDDEDRIEVEYTAEGVLITTGDGDKQSGLSVEEHSYDNDTSLFLWRTINFAEGYEASYITIITNQRTEQQVVLRVPGIETITVPAGQFQAWRVEIITSNARQVAWYADTPARPLVRYDNSRGTIFELTTTP